MIFAEGQQCMGRNTRYVQGKTPHGFACVYLATPYARRISGGTSTSMVAQTFGPEQPSIEQAQPLLRSYRRLGWVLFQRIRAVGPIEWALEVRAGGTTFH